MSEKDERRERARDLLRVAAFDCYHHVGIADCGCEDKAVERVAKWLAAEIERLDGVITDLRVKCEVLQTEAATARRAALEEAADLARQQGLTLLPEKLLAMAGHSHTHKAKYDDGDRLLDECDLCGRDIRESVHHRTLASQGEEP